MRKLLYIAGMLFLTLTSVMGQNTHTVSSLTNTGAGTSLQEIVTLVNANNVAATINFSVSGTIIISANLTINAPNVVIDGSGQSVIIDGTGTSGLTGFLLNKTGAVVRNLTITKVNIGIQTNADNCVISQNTITNVTNSAIWVKKKNAVIRGNTLSGNGAAGTAGIRVRDNAENTFIGGNLYNAEERNLIYGFGTGVYLSENSTSQKATATIIRGNIIGKAHKLPGDCDAASSTYGGVNTVGIIVDDYAINTVIGPSANDFFLESDMFANIISGNTNHGIEVATRQTYLVEIYGNYIGLDACGMGVNGQKNGISVASISDNVKIGSDANQFLGNVISRNKIYALSISAGNCQIEGNIFGTDRTLTKNLGNNYGPESGGQDAAITFGNNAQCRDILFRDNLVVNSPNIGLRVRGGNHTVTGNQFGYVEVGGVYTVMPNATAIHLLGGGQYQITENVMLGSSVAAIEARGAVGVWIKSNLFGITPDGLFTAQNTRGVSITKGTATVSPGSIHVGGKRTTEGNFFVGTTSTHVEITNGSNMFVRGNYIGVDHFDRVGGGKTGISINKTKVSTVTIGGNRELEYGNVISGHSEHAIFLSDTSNNVTIQGNIIGLDPSGTKKGRYINGTYNDYKNSLDGVLTTNTTYNIAVGGSESTALGNIIGNNRYGLNLRSISGVNTVCGNYIGTNIGGYINLGNALGGVRLDGAKETTIGGETSDLSNTIAYNGGFAISLLNNADKVSFIGNQLYESGTPVLYSGTINAGIVAPQVSQVNALGESKLSITVSSAPGDLLDVYAVDEASPNDIREYLGSFSCVGGNCTVEFPNASKKYDNYRFTVTTAAKRTSPFSNLVAKTISVEECNNIDDFHVPVAPNFGNQKVKSDNSILHISFNTQALGETHPLFLNYVGGGEAWSYTRSVRISAIDDQGTNNPLKTYVRDFRISELQPSSDFYLDFSDIAGVVDRFTFECFEDAEVPVIAEDLQNILTEQLIINNSGFDMQVSYTTRFDVNEKSGVAFTPINLAVNTTGQSCNNQFSRVVFSWDLPNDMYTRDYDLQILKLEPYLDQAGNVAVAVNWDEAATIEVIDEIINGQPSYEMTLAEGTGYYLWRVRAIGNYYDGGRSDARNYGAWYQEQAPTASGLYSKLNDVNITTTITNNLNSGSVSGGLFHYTQFDEDINFIYSKVLSEGSRQAETITYANGLSMTQQVQTRLQSMGEVIATQSVNDYMGRPAMQSLPAPVNCSELAYQEDFFTNSGNIAYSAADFDFGTNLEIYSPGVQSRTIGIGPNYYYSDINDGSFYDLGNRVPNAEGSAYVRTLFSNDPSGRVKQQSGPGDKMKIGNPLNETTHNTTTSYVSVAQEELDLIFGSEAPFARDVYKVITTDPNKVTSVAYITKAGQTIATCLDNNRDLTNMLNDANVGTEIRESMVGGEIDEQTHTAYDVRVIEVTEPTRNYSFSYSFIPSSFNIFNENCTEICQFCDHRVDIQISDLENPNSDFNATLHLQLNTDALDCNTANAPVNFTGFTVLGIDQCNTQGCSKVFDESVFPLGQPVAGASFSKTFIKGRYLLEKRVFVNNKVTGETDLLYLEEKIANMRAAYDDWNPIANPSDNCLGFVADEDPESGCETNIYCESDGSFGIPGSESFGKMKEFLKKSLDDEYNKGLMSPHGYYSNYMVSDGVMRVSRYYLHGDPGIGVIDSELEQLLIDISQTETSCEQFSQCMVATFHELEMNMKLIERGAKSSLLYNVDNDLSLNETEFSDLHYDDEFDYLKKVFECSGLEAGIKLDAYCSSVSTNFSYNDFMNTIKPNEKIASFDNVSLNFGIRNVGDFSSATCAGINAIRQYGYLEVPIWAKSGSNQTLALIFAAYNDSEYKLYIDDVLVINPNNINIDISGRDFLKIELLQRRNSGVSMNNSISWFKNGQWELVPPYYFRPTCSIKNELHIYNGNGSAHTDPRVLSLKIPNLDQQPWQNGNGSNYAGSTNQNEIIACELIKGFFNYNVVQDLSSGVDLQETHLKNLDLPDDVDVSYESTVQRVCEAYYEAQNGIEITPTQKEALDAQFTTNVRNNCLKHCAQSHDLYNQAIETYVYEQNAIRGNFSPTIESYDANNQPLSDWLTSFEGYDDADRNCYIESIKNRCMDACEVLPLDEVIELTNSYPVFKPMGNGAIHVDEFRQEAIGFIYDAWLSAIQTRVANEPQITDDLLTDDLFHFNELPLQSGIVRNMQTQDFLVYNYNTTTQQLEYFEFKVYAGLVWHEHGEGTADDKLLEAVFYINNKNSYQNAWSGNKNGLAINLDGLTDELNLNQINFGNVRQNLFDIYFDYNDLFHAAPGAIIKAEMDELDNNTLGERLIGSYATLANYSLAFALSLANNSSSLNDPSEFLNPRLNISSGLSLPLFDQPLYWDDSYADGDVFREAVAAKINASNNEFEAVHLSAAEGYGYIMVFLTGNHPVLPGVSITLDNDLGTTEALAFIANVFNYNSQNGRWSYSRTGRLFQSSFDVNFTVLDLQNEVTDISGYQEGCQAGFNSMAPVAIPVLIPNGLFNVTVACSNNNQHANNMFSYCVTPTWRGHGTVQLNLNPDQTITTNPTLIPSGSVSGAAQMWGKFTNGESICTHVNLISGQNYTLNISLSGAGAAGDPTVSNAIIAGYNGPGTDELQGNSAVANFLTIPVTKGQWQTFDVTFTPTADFANFCIYPLPNNNGDTIGVINVDDVFLSTNGVSSSSDIKNAKIRTAFEEKVFPALSSNLEYIYTRGGEPSVEQREIVLHESENLKQSIQLDYQYSTGLISGDGTTFSSVKEIKVEMIQDCNNTVTAKSFVIKTVPGYTGFLVYQPEENQLVDMRIDENGGLVVQFLVNNAFNTFETDSEIGNVKVLDKNGVVLFHRDVNKAFWEDVFVADGACQPDYGSCEACLKWMPLDEHYNGLLADIEEPESAQLFPSQQFDFCQLATQYAEDQVERFLREKLDEAEAAARASFKQNCLVNVKDKLNFSYTLGYYHFTRYYYDRAGNLIQTVPPQDNDITVDQSRAFLRDYRQYELAEANPNLSDLPKVYDPTFNLNTTYQYNSIGQLISQTTPDGGTTRFWYNALGQLVLSQDAQQLVDGRFSYTTYDKLGRIIEVGELHGGYAHNYAVENSEVNEMIDLNLWSVLDFPANVVSQTIVKREVSKTYYSTPAAGINYRGQAQRHLRNRVSYVQRDVEQRDAEGNFSTSTDRFSTYYSYDPHGNVNWMIQEIPGVGQKTIAYEYDLVSGNVNRVIYMEGTTEQFIHRYSYDEDNRITLVETSTDGFQWTHEANYDYYLHGPLARTEIGQDNIQGIDYTYTIEGYLKAINEASLTPANDPGIDGATASAFLADEFGMELGYYEGDYTRGTAIGTESTLNPWNTLNNTDYGLYNGNIAYWMANTRTGDGEAGVNGAHLRAFRYDKLNRLRISDFMERDGAGWNASQRQQNLSATSLTVSANNKFDEVFTYDRNGNISTAHRYGGTTFLDELTYHYENPGLPPTEKEGIYSNKLNYVADLKGSMGAGDLGAQSTNNYTYDAEGNLTADVSEGITIIWNVLNKVARVTSTTDILEFDYDASGNRVAKKRKEPGTLTLTEATYYVRDASGNVMGVYQHNGTDTRLTELPIYGSDRVGQYTPENLIVNTTPNYVIIEETTPSFEFQTRTELSEFPHWVYGNEKIVFDNGGVSTIPNDQTSYPFLGKSAVIDDVHGLPVAQFITTGIPQVNSLQNGIHTTYYNKVNAVQSFIDYVIDYNSAFAYNISSNINYNWENGAPIEFGAQTHDFGIKYEGYLFIDVPGTYSFTVVADDEAELIINGTTVATKVYTGPTTQGNYTFPSVGFYPFRLDYLEHTGGASVQLSWRKPNESGTSHFLIPNKHFFIHQQTLPTKAPSQPDYVSGLEARYYKENINSFEGENNIYVNWSKEIARGLVSTIDFNFTDAPPLQVGTNTSNYSIGFHGYIYFPDAGTYNFSAEADDRMFFTISNIGVIDIVGPPWTGTGSFVATSPGYYPITMRYSQVDGPGYLNLKWKKSTETNFSLVPASAFFHSPKLYVTEYLTHPLYEKNGHAEAVNGNTNQAYNIHKVEDNNYGQILSASNVVYSNSEGIMVDKDQPSVIMQIPGSETAYYLVTAKGGKVYYHTFSSESFAAEEINIPITGLNYDLGLVEKVSFTSYNDNTEGGITKLYTLTATTTSLDLKELVFSRTGLGIITTHQPVSGTAVYDLGELQISPDGTRLAFSYTREKNASTLGHYIGTYDLSATGVPSNFVATEVGEEAKLSALSIPGATGVSTKLHFFKAVVSLDFTPTGSSVYFVQNNYLGTSISDLYKAHYISFGSESVFRTQNIKKMDLATNIVEQVSIEQINSSKSAGTVRRGKDGAMYFGIASNYTFLRKINDQSWLTDIINDYDKSNDGYLPINTYRLRAEILKPLVHTTTARTIGQRSYELKDHLGNVRAVVADARVSSYNAGVFVNTTTLVNSWADYYAFGWAMPGRFNNDGGYRYGFNGMEKVDEFTGSSSHYDFGARIYDSRVSKFLSLDPLTKVYPYWSPYNYSGGNSPINVVDDDGKGPLSWLWKLWFQSAGKGVFTLAVETEVVAGAIATGVAVFNQSGQMTDKIGYTMFGAGGAAFLEPINNETNEVARLAIGGDVGVDLAGSYSHTEFAGEVFDKLESTYIGSAGPIDVAMGTDYKTWGLDFGISKGLAVKKLQYNWITTLSMTYDEADKLTPINPIKLLTYQMKVGKENLIELDGKMVYEGEIYIQSKTNEKEYTGVKVYSPAEKNDEGEYVNKNRWETKAYSKEKKTSKKT